MFDDISLVLRRVRFHCNLDYVQFRNSVLVFRFQVLTKQIQGDGVYPDAVVNNYALSVYYTSVGCKISG